MIHNSNCFKIGQCLICLPDRAGEYHVAFINVLPLLSSVLNMQTLAFGVMGSFNTHYEQEMDTWLMNSPGREVVKCRL
jgi:hypothetical protein